jgi:hypothetical protein
VITAGIRFHHARVDCETFAFDKAICHASRNDALEDVAQNITLSKALETIDRKRGVMWHLVFKIELTEPSVSKMQSDFLAQTPLMPDAVAVSDNKHPHHEFGINRRTTNLAIKRP